jgi:hypothetical protein
MRLLRRCVLALLLTLLVAAAAASALAAIAWQMLAARPGQWSHRIGIPLAGRMFERDASVAVLVRAATHPLAARVIDGRRLDTGHGRWQLRSLPDGALSARCEPCRFALPALGPQPLVVDRAELLLHGEGADRYRLRLALGAQRAIAIEGRAAFDRDGRLAIDARLAPTPIADVVQVLGRDIAERETVQVDGTLALSLAATLPRGAWRIEPKVEGFEVFGLQTERLADLQRPAACRVDARADVPTIDGWLPRAVIAAEDARFHDHPGYDLRAMLDALAHNQRPGAALTGASTLTQQLAKLVVAGDERSATRKLRELLYAVEMERTLGKARILQLYLALAPWGDGICGAERAVRVHLGQRDPSAIGPVAASWLASLLTAPDAHLAAEHAAGEVDRARVTRMLDAVRPMRADRREKAQVQLLFWSPPALARLREPLPAPPSEPPEAATVTPSVAPSP